MENKKEKSLENDTSSESSVIRGKKAIRADEDINKKDLDKSEVKKDQEKDAEQWRNEE